MPTLFSPLSFAGLTLRNRAAMPPMWSGKATAEGFVTPAIVEYHRVRAAAGTALVIVEHSFVHPQGRHSSAQIAVHDDACVEGLSELAAAIQAEGSVACLQISHAGARASSRVTGLPVAAPSPVATTREASPDAPAELTRAQIDEVIEAFAAAAARARAARFDAVEIHAAHCSPRTERSSAASSSTSTPSEWASRAEPRSRRARSRSRGGRYARRDIARNALPAI